MQTSTLWERITVFKKGELKIYLLISQEYIKFTKLFKFMGLEPFVVIVLFNISTTRIFKFFMSLVEQSSFNCSYTPLITQVK